MEPQGLKYDRRLTHSSSWTAEACTWSQQLPLPPPFNLSVSRLFWEMRKVWEGKSSILQETVCQDPVLKKLPGHVTAAACFQKRKGTLETERWAGGQGVASASGGIFLLAVLDWKKEQFKWGLEDSAFSREIFFPCRLQQYMQNSIQYRLIYSLLPCPCCNHCSPDFAYRPNPGKGSDQGWWYLLLRGNGQGQSQTSGLLFIDSLGFQTKQLFPKILVI